MVQIIYTIAAVMILSVLVVNVNVSIHGNQERMMFNELALEVTSVGAEMLNEIGKYSYDPVALASVYGFTLEDRNALRDASMFGVGSLCDPNPASGFFGCIVINDFHGKTATRSVTRRKDGVDYTVDYDITDIRIRYVAEAPPHAYTDNSKSFAKEATITIAIPALVDGSGNPIEFTMSRVFQYPNYERGKTYSGN
jgi:hypothetical protein